MLKKLILFSLIVVLVFGNIYFYNKSEKLDYAISIGTPSGIGAEVERLDLSTAISDRDDADLLIFSLMSGVSIEKPEVSGNIPNSTIWFNHWDKGVTYYVINLWNDGDKIIFETNVNSDTPLYKEIDGNRAADIAQILEKYRR